MFVKTHFISLCFTNAKRKTFMPLELRTQRDGSLRPNWYGRYEINGRLFRPNLLVKIAGTPPLSKSLRDEGDGAFERSRAKAQAKLDSLVEEARTKQGSARLVEKLYEIKTGEPIKTVTLENLPQEWAKIPRRRKPDDRYASQCQSTLKRFATFVHQENVKVTEIAHGTRPMARLFLDAESNRGITAKTWNDTLKLLRATLAHLLPAGAINPFSDLPTRETETVFRKPYSPEELAAILKAAIADEFTRPVLVMGICTAMRRGDCCLISWAAVDLKQHFITVKTAKTGQTVSIPIFPLLYEELKLRTEKRKSDDMYVFPEQAQMYLKNPDGITWRVQKVLAAAGFRDEGELSEAKNGNIVNQTENSPTLPSLIRGTIHVARKTGLRRVSVRDFHSFRVTWVTLALTAGVPLELVQKVTGHKTAEIVLKHYFQPGREAFRQALQTAMPKLLTNGEKTPKEQLKTLIAQTTVKNWEKNKAKIEELLKAI